MFHQLRYGTQSTVVVDVAGDAIVARCVRALQPLTDTISAVQAALAAPLNPIARPKAIAANVGF